MGIPSCFIMHHPEFEPIQVKTGWGSIGSGKSREDAEFFANLHGDDLFAYMQAEVAMGKGGTALAVSSSVSSRLALACLKKITAQATISAA